MTTFAVELKVKKRFWRPKDGLLLDAINDLLYKPFRCTSAKMKFPERIAKLRVSVEKFPQLESVDPEFAEGLIAEAFHYKGIRMRVLKKLKIG